MTLTLNITIQCNVKIRFIALAMLILRDFMLTENSTHGSKLKAGFNEFKY